MPVLNKGSIERMVSMCGASMPRKLTRILARYGDHPQAMREAGMAYAIDQIADLIASGVDGVHLYTMNNPAVARQISDSVDEVLRYMGTPPDRAEPAIRKLAEGCARELLGVVRPRWAARTFELTPEEGGVRLSSGLLLPGEDLKRHLAGCRRAVLFCATLSAQADALIRRAESGDMLRALALDSCATAAVEQL